MIERRVPMADEVLLIRPARADDAARFAEFFADLPLEDEYVRFFSAYRPDDAFVTRMATANEAGACQLIALVEHGDGRPDTIVAEAGAWPLKNGNAELAITVLRGHRGWLGPYLLDVLVEEARARGFANLEADVLMTNSGMLAVLRGRGTAVVAHDGYSSVRLAISTSARVPTWPPNDDRPRVLVESSGGRWAGENDAAHTGLQVIVCPGPKGRPHGRCPALEGEVCPLVAEADALVVHLSPSDTLALVEAHASVHPSIPICVQTGADPARALDAVANTLRSTR